MTDNRTTELAATERICEQLEAAGVSFVRSEQIIEGTYWGVTWFVGETKFEFRENDKRTDLIAFNATPEQAIAATLGTECHGYEQAAIEAWKSIKTWNTREYRHAYEQRITGDGSDWGEIMCDAFDSLLAAACDACTFDELERFEAYIMKEMGE